MVPSTYQRFLGPTVNLRGWKMEGSSSHRSLKAVGSEIVPPAWQKRASKLACLAARHSVNLPVCMYIMYLCMYTHISMFIYIYIYTSKLVPPNPCRAIKISAAASSPSEEAWKIPSSPAHADQIPAPATRISSLQTEQSALDCQLPANPI